MANHLKTAGVILAKLHFYFSAMNAGKSTTLLQSSYNYNERGMDTLIFIPEVVALNKVTSRLGLHAAAIPIGLRFELYHYIAQALQQNPNLKCILVDEAQFLSKQHVQELARVTVDFNLPVLAYGLRTDFMGEPFEGSKYLLAWADQLIELKTICHCGRKATMNLRVDATGTVLRIGAQVEIGGNDRYVAVCRQHFLTATTEPC